MVLFLAACHDEQSNNPQGLTEQSQADIINVHNYI